MTEDDHFIIQSGRIRMTRVAKSKSFANQVLRAAQKAGHFTSKCVGGPIVSVQVHADGAITAAAIGGQHLDLTDFDPATDGNLNVSASALAADGFMLDLTLVGDTPVRISHADMSDSLPGLPAARPTNTMPTPGATRDGTAVRSMFAF